MPGFFTAWGLGVSEPRFGRREGRGFTAEFGVRVVPHDRDRAPGPALVGTETRPSHRSYGVGRLCRGVGRNLVRLRWAAGTAALVGAAGGSVLAVSLRSLGLTPTGAAPLLAGDAAAFVDAVLGAAVGAFVAALVTLVVGWNGGETAAGVIGALAGLVGAAVVAEAGPSIAQVWTDAFSSNPLAAGLVGGALAGALAGAAVGSILRPLAPAQGPEPQPRKLAALMGSVAGLLSGLGGGSLGSSLAQSVRVCPNGYYGNPPVPPGQCSVGISPSAVLVGGWAGAVVGALLAAGVAALLAFLSRRAR